ncbi:MAG TPA: hypothetical protein VLT86_13760 [Vicinamibacterales bacterium]|nr:hypothetical protein [Vicinamibacterales bacterium]
MIGVLLLALLQQPASPPDVQLQVGLKVYRGERVTASATSGNDALSGSVWTDSTFCGVGSGSTNWSASDRIRWQYSGRIVQHAGSSYTVEIDWQRDGGSAAALPKTTQQLVLQMGLPQVLDTLTPSANGCGATAVRVEVAVVPASPGNFWRGAAGATASGSGTAGGRGRGISGMSGSSTTGGGARGGGGTGVNGAGASANAGAGTGQDSFSIRGSNNMSALEFARMLASGTYIWNYRPPAVGPAGGGAAGSGATRGGAGDVNVAAGGGRGIFVAPRTFSRQLTPITTGNYDAELWLVHTPPGGTEETQHLTVHFGIDGEAAAFPLVTVSAPSGPATVDVAVSLRVMADEKGATVLRVIIVRRVDAGTGASTGATTKVIPVPAASETVSFELPDLRGAAQSALADHRFAVRLKIASGKGDAR